MRAGVQIISRFSYMALDIRCNMIKITYLQIFLKLGQLFGRFVYFLSRSNARALN
jgi:hypothetical protein